MQKDIETILNIILKEGRSEVEAVFIAHVVGKEIDKYFEHLAKIVETREN